MLPVILKQIDTLNLALPTLQLTLPTEPEPEKPNIVILKKSVKSNSTELF